MILGGGPNRIGQGIEFDYCCVHAAFALKDDGFETIMVNCNPETVSTDYDTSDRLYFEPLTFEDVLAIVARRGAAGVIVQFGGQTPLKLAGAREGRRADHRHPPDAIDRPRTASGSGSARRSQARQPPNGTAFARGRGGGRPERIGYPVLLRPSYVLGGRAMEIVNDEAGLRDYMHRAVMSPDHPVLGRQFLDDAIEIDVDCIGDGHDVVDRRRDGAHRACRRAPGDSACALPPRLPPPDADRDPPEATRLRMALASSG